MDEAGPGQGVSLRTRLSAATAHVTATQSREVRCQTIPLRSYCAGAGVRWKISVMPFTRRSPSSSGRVSTNACSTGINADPRSYGMGIIGETCTRAKGRVGTRVGGRRVRVDIDADRHAILLISQHHLYLQEVIGSALICLFVTRRLPVFVVCIYHNDYIAFGAEGMATVATGDMDCSIPAPGPPNACSRCAQMARRSVFSSAVHHLEGSTSSLQVVQNSSRGCPSPRWLITANATEEWAGRRYRF